MARDDFVVATDRYLETVGEVETYSILIDVLANDEDADGDRLEVVVQGEFGLPPQIWVPDPVGTVNYLGAGVFDLTLGKEELGDATEVTFQYELEGAASPATVRVTVSGEGPAPEVDARQDIFGKIASCWARLPVLANDTGLDTIVDFSQTTTGNGLVQRHPADPDVLVFRGTGGGKFTYKARDSRSGVTDSAEVFLRSIDDPPDRFDIATKMSDCFGRQDGVPLDGQTVGFFHDSEVAWPTWTANLLTHLDEAGTLESPIPADPGGTSTRRKAYLPFDADAWLAEGSAFDLEGTFRADSSRAQWVALAFTHGNGGGFTDSDLDLWLQLDVETGELFLNGRWDGAGLQEVLATADPATDAYPFVPGGVNHLRLRYDTAPATPTVDAWINGVPVFSGVEHVDVTTSIENVGFFVHYGTLASSPGEVWFDDFELRVGDVSEAVLLAKSDDPMAGVDVENGGTVTLDPLHVGCTSDHVACHSFQEASLFLRNDGNEPLEVSHLTFEGPTEWSSTGPATDPFTVPAGGSEEIRVRVDALEVGETSSRLELSTNDPDLPKLTVSFATEVTQAPVADFVHYCDGLSCSFDGSASTGVGLHGSGFVWLLDGGSATVGPTRSHTFFTSGVHTVELRVTDATGAQHRLQRTIGVAPEAAFTYACSQATRTCEFDAAASTEGAVSFRYDFGDGTSHEGTGDPGAFLVSHTYATSGRYNVSLTIVDGDGQEAGAAHEVALLPIPDFAATCSSDTLTCEFDASLSTPQMILYEWSFGDGARGTGLQASHAYATSGVYPVMLTVVDSSGHVEAVTKPVAVPPNAEFTVTCDPESRSCTFDGFSSSPDVAHEWDFGDGSPLGAGAVLEHTYATSGVFTVTLTVTDSSNQTDSASRDVVIPPQAEFTAFCDSLRCQFDASGSSPGVSSYSWAFGHDGETGTGVDPIHEFPDAGDYEVSLTVTDASGQTATTTKTVTVFNEELFLLLLLDDR